MTAKVQTTSEFARDWRALEVDEAKLTAKYKEEREKRLRKEGINQYKHVANSATLRPMTDDPFAIPGFKRDPVTAQHDIVIIGGGVGGLQAAARLVQAGHNNILIIERGGDFGGVWYWNRYPGIQIDIESYIYMPLLEEVGYVPTMKYSPGHEIREYFKILAKHFDLYSKALFQTEALELRWDEKSTHWDISTNRQDRIQAKWIVPSTGPFDNPKFPGIPGIETFKGHQFHSSRWDYDYTGGDSCGNLTKLADKRVGIIGTGATGIQIVPHLGQWSKELFVFQRTPSSIDVRENKPTDTEWFKSQKPGWQKERMDNFTTIVSSGKVDEDLVADGWTKTVASLNGWFGQSKVSSSQNAEETARLLQLADFKKMESIRRRVEDIVKDPKTAEALKPYYDQYCKRPCFHDDYLPTFNRPNVTLVDTQGRGVDCITERGVKANSVEYELDCIIYATGFEYATDWDVRHHSKIFGTNGVSISDRWKDGPVTFHGWSVHGFPNCFLISSAQTSGVPNYYHSLEDQSSHLIYLISKCKKDGIDRLEATAEAEEKWVEEVVRVGKDRSKYLMNCTPGYYNDEGQVSDITSKNNPYGGGVDKFLETVRGWRNEDKLAGLKVSFAGV